MQLRNPLNIKSLGSVFGLLGILVLFIGSAYLSNRYATELQLLVHNDGVFGISTYVLVAALATVIAPISALPLMPLAASIWGWVIAGVLSIVGWVIGSQIAFFLARKYGKNLIQKFISLQKLEQFEEHFSEKDIFWTVVFLRITVPVDILSYALGLFSNMSYRSFFLATLLGVTPFAFIFSYLGSFPPFFQIISLIAILIFIFLAHSFYKTYHQKDKK